MKLKPHVVLGGRKTIFINVDGERKIFSRGRTIIVRSIKAHNRGDHNNMSPAKVEILLEEVTLQDMYRSLAALQELVKATFSPVVNIVLEGGIPDKASSGGGRGGPLYGNIMLV